MGEAPTAVFFTLPFEPRPQLRHRHLKKSGRTYDPSVADKKAVRDHVESIVLEKGWPVPVFPDQPILLQMQSTFTLPRSKHRVRNPVEAAWYTLHRNDWDNLGKLVCDALNGLLWTDDGQICWTTTTRVRGAQGVDGRTKVGVQPIKGEPFELFDPPF